MTQHLYELTDECSPSCYVADEGGETRMSGGIPWITLPAGYLGSSFIGACLIACGFDTNASKIACIVLAVFFLFTLWWARKNWLYVFHGLRRVRLHPTRFHLGHGLLFSG